VRTFFLTSLPPSFTKGEIGVSLLCHRGKGVDELVPSSLLRLFRRRSRLPFPFRFPKEAEPFTGRQLVRVVRLTRRPLIFPGTKGVSSSLSPPAMGGQHFLLPLSRKFASGGKKIAFPLSSTSSSPLCAVFCARISFWYAPSAGAPSQRRAYPAIFPFLVPFFFFLPKCPFFLLSSSPFLFIAMGFFHRGRSFFPFSL